MSCLVFYVRLDRGSVCGIHLHTNPSYGGSVDTFIWRARSYSVACGHSRLMADFYDETGGQ